jgi:tellurite methyltransferase
MKYDILYKKNNSVWGDKPSLLLQAVYERVENSAEFLDLGCGQGRDSLFMLKKGFSVTAVDKSQEGLNRIAEYIKNEGLPPKKIVLVCEDVKDFAIEKNKFTIISAFNVLQFLPKIEALLVIDRIKNNLISGGYVIISGFLVSDPLYQKNSQKNGFFEKVELKGLFSDFEMIMYEEKVINDPGHPDWPEPHQHYVVKVIARKK